MMALIKISIFVFLIITVKIMFTLFFKEEDEKVNMMKEVSDFIEFLRIYSCSMRMSFEEVLLNYNFKYANIKLVFNRLLQDLKEDNTNKSVSNSFEIFLEKQIKAPMEFNTKVSKLLDFYGNSMSDVLDNKLTFLKNDINKYIDKYEEEYKERKNLLNKLSLLLGSLIAIVLM